MGDDLRNQPLPAFFSMTQELVAAVDSYIAKLTAHEDEALLQTDRSLAEAGLPTIAVSANQGKFLHVLARIANARRILELGTLAGYSTIWMARALPTDGQLVTLELDSHHAAVARQNIERAGLSSVVEVREGAALDLLAQLEAEGVEPFDMVFIDADKPPYAEYFERAVRLSRPGALIVADNVIRNGQVLEPAPPDERVQGVQRLNAMLANRTDVTATILQMVGVKEYDGMVIAVKN